MSARLLLCQAFPLDPHLAESWLRSATVAAAGRVSFAVVQYRFSWGEAQLMLIGSGGRSMPRAGFRAGSCVGDQGCRGSHDRS